MKVKGLIIDDETRCKHYHTKEDIIAIKFYCCDTYYPCIKCHDECADHNHQVIPESKFNEEAILCGVCKSELTVDEYLNSKSTCPRCSSAFNRGCENHYHLYFEKTKQ
ncbi:CHY zinc finger protein [Bacillus solimangrovi]|uniref:CHY zinc finger protein n=1 Tax=Bacillus solimangrovi TaxID=1305675 RepID=UPI0009F37F8C|nr:CHY zinc finger protein [Bacillus solimangrovi]